MEFGQVHSLRASCSLVFLGGGVYVVGDLTLAGGGPVAFQSQVH